MVWPRDGPAPSSKMWPKMWTRVWPKMWTRDGPGCGPKCGPAKCGPGPCVCAPGMGPFGRPGMAQAMRPGMGHFLSFPCGSPTAASDVATQFVARAPRERVVGRSILATRDSGHQRGPECAPGMAHQGWPRVVPHVAQACAPSLGHMLVVQKCHPLWPRDVPLPWATPCPFLGPSIVAQGWPRDVPNVSWATCWLYTNVIHCGPGMCPFPGPPLVLSLGHPLWPRDGPGMCPMCPGPHVSWTNPEPGPRSPTAAIRRGSSVRTTRALGACGRGIHPHQAEFLSH
jgi:hypothetical protein